MDETPGFEPANLQLLVLDEADRILDMGFAATLDAILANLPAEGRQTLLFSATQVGVGRIGLRAVLLTWVAFGGEVQRIFVHGFPVVSWTWTLLHPWTHPGKSACRGTADSAVPRHTGERGRDLAASYSVHSVSDH
jgi:hypothetical protein